MEADKLEKLHVMGLKILTDINESGKADYEKKFTLTYKKKGCEIKDSKKFMFELCEAMYDDFVELAKEYNTDFVGVNATYDGEEEENAIKLSTLESMREYGEGNLSPLYEFIAMTVNK